MFSLEEAKELLKEAEKEEEWEQEAYYLFERKYSERADSGHLVSVCFTSGTLPKTIFGMNAIVNFGSKASQKDSGKFQEYIKINKRCPILAIIDSENSSICHLCGSENEITEFLSEIESINGMSKFPVMLLPISEGMIVTTVPTKKIIQPQIQE